MAGQRVLITGATGFVGTRFVEGLPAGWRLRALVRPSSRVSTLEAAGAELVVGHGVDDPAALARAVAGVDVVLHLAATTRALTAAEHERVNGAGTRALLAALLAARDRPRRIVYLSSLAAVGPALAGPVGADTPPRPLTAYGRGKLAGEAACLAAKGELEVAVLRAPAVYGPGDRDLLRFFRLAALGVLPLPAGERQVQFVHVDDLVEAIRLAALVPDVSGVYHIAEPRVYDWNEAAAAIISAVGRGRVVRVPHALITLAGSASGLGARLVRRPTIFDADKARELLAPAWTCETERAERDLGFRAATALPAGFAAAAAWYRSRGLL
jgi:dihydroflavonol-4-reductase